MMRQLIFCLTLMFVSPIFSQSSPKDQWIWGRVNDPVTQKIWLKNGLNPGPNQSLVYGKSVQFNWTGIVFTTDPATSDCNTPWCLIGKFWSDSLNHSVLLNNPNAIMEFRKQNFFETLTTPELFALVMIPALLLFLLLWWLSYRKQNRWRTKDPVTSGDPMVLDGVGDTTAGSALQNQINRMYPGREWIITNLRRGRLYGQGDVHYAGNPAGQRRQFSGQTAYAATATSAGTQPQEVYCLQDCGNDARVGNYIGGQDLIFHVDQNLPEATNVSEKNQADSFKLPFVLAEELFKSGVDGRIYFRSEVNGSFVFKIETAGKQEEK